MKDIASPGMIGSSPTGASERQSNMVWLGTATVHTNTWY
jgi:hypothetical protein